MILVTGSTGFVGSALCRELVARRVAVRGSTRSLNSSCSIEGCQYIELSTVDESTNWASALVSVDCVIHCAGLSIASSGIQGCNLDAFRRVNVAGTLNLANQASIAGVKRFIYLSSIKVNGEQTSSESGFKDVDPPFPSEPYGISKWEAEVGLNAMRSKVDMDIVIIRPSAICGQSFNSNFYSLFRAVRYGVPLPLGSVENRRSFIGLSSFVDFVIRCSAHASAPGKTFLICDGHPISTPELINLMANAVGRAACMIPVPVPLLRKMGSVIGRRNQVERLVGSLWIESSSARDILSWSPPISLEQEIRQMASRT